MNGERVYHYTSLDVLWHLMENVEKSKDKDNFVFWATNILFMNDPQEFVYGLGVLMKAIEKIDVCKGLDKKYHVSNLWANLKGDNLENWKKTFLNEMLKSNETPYVISFSRQKDSLPMWVQYGNEGKGVCLVMVESRYAIDGIIKDADNIPITTYDYMDVMDVIYDDKEIFVSHNRLYSIIDDFYSKEYKEKVQCIKQESVKGLQMEFLNACEVLIAPFIKSSEYRGEREVRMSTALRRDFWNSPDKIKFRSNTNGNIIPYVEVEIPKRHMESVIIGPLANYDLTSKALEMLKQRYDIQFDIIQSQVKYRKY